MTEGNGSKEAAVGRKQMRRIGKLLPKHAVAVVFTEAGAEMIANHERGEISPESPVGMAVTTLAFFADLEFDDLLAEARRRLTARFAPEPPKPKLIITP